MNDLHDVYLNGYINNIENYKEGKQGKKDTIKKIVYYGIKAINTGSKEDTRTYTELLNEMDFINVVMAAISSITPNELLTIFPLKKEYKGHKTESKDYFYSMDYIKEYGIDKTIDDPISFLWEYTNIDISLFVVRIMSITNKISQLEGKTSLTDKFINEFGISPMTKYKDETGKNFIINKDGKVLKEKKLYPKYLKVIK